MLDKLITERQSCRDFDGRAVEKAALEQILTAASLAPSARNAQPWTFYACSGSAADKVRAACQVGGANAFLNNCATFVVVALRPSPAPAKDAKPAPITLQDFRPFDAGLATMQACLKAQEIGVSSCIIGWLDSDKIRAALSTDEEIKVVLALGYASSGYPLRPKTRRPLSATVVFKS